MIDAFYALAELTRNDSLFWRLVTYVAVVVGLVITLAFLGEVGHLLQRWYRETLGSWWADRHARQMRHRVADALKEINAEQELERKRLQTVAEWRRR